MKRKTVTVGRCFKNLRYPGWTPYPVAGASTTPLIRLRGHRLEREGFCEGRSVPVDALLGTLVLTLAERPSPRRCSPEEARELLAGVAARLREIRALLVEIHDGLPAAEEGDGRIEARGPQDLVVALRGAIESVVEEDLDAAIEQLTEASGVTAEGLARRSEERREDERATRRLAERIAPRVAELLSGDARPRPRRRPRETGRTR